MAGVFYVCECQRRVWKDTRTRRVMSSEKRTATYPSGHVHITCVTRASYSHVMWHQTLPAGKIGKFVRIVSGNA
jgi:hypothetical protein